METAVDVTSRCEILGSYGGDYAYRLPLECDAL